MADRVTQVTGDAIGTDADAKNRVTQVTTDVVAEGDDRAKVTQVTADVVAEGDDRAKVTQTSVDAIADGEHKELVTQFSVDVIADVVAHSPNVRATQVSVDVIAEPGIDILTPSPLNNAWLSDPYSTFIVATGGLGTLSWAVTAGTTPTGFNLNSATGEITGPITQIGTFVFDITVSDAHGHSSTVTYSLFVDSFGAAPEAVNLGIGVFGLGYTIHRGLSGIECHIEMIDVGLGTSTSSIGYNRSLTYFPRNSFPDDQLFYLEAIGSNAGSTAVVFTVTDGGSNSQTLTLPSGYNGRFRNSVPFPCPDGIYRIVAGPAEFLNAATLGAFRIVAPLKNGQEFVSEVRLTNSGQSSTIDQNISGPDLARTSSAGHADFDDGWVSTGQPVWRYEADAWERISSVTVYIVMANASFPDQTAFKYSEIAFVDIDDIGEFNFTRKITTANLNVFFDPSHFTLPINPATLRDGHRYQIYFRSVKPDGFFTFNTYLHKSRIGLVLNPGNKAEIYNRCAPSERTYMSGFMAPNPEIYFQVETNTAIETVELRHLGSSTPAGNTTGGPGTATGVSLLTVASESVRSAEISDLLIAGRDYVAGLSGASQAELVYRFGNVVRHRSHNYMF